MNNNRLPQNEITPTHITYPDDYVDENFTFLKEQILKHEAIKIENGRIIVSLYSEKFEMEKDGKKYLVTVFSYFGQVKIIVENLTSS
jgi:hypothetical protein